MLDNFFKFIQLVTAQPGLETEQSELESLSSPSEFILL